MLTFKNINQLDIIATKIMHKRKYSLLHKEIFNIKNQILEGSMQYVFFLKKQISPTSLKKKVIKFDANLKQFVQCNGT